MKAIELFCGIGGFRLACENIGIKTIWTNDIDAKACEIYRSNFGKDEIVEGDINKLIDSIPDHDLLTGGFPCQPFSSAGKKQGINDSRGTLFRSIIEILNLKKPKYFILENVKRLLSMQSGSHFATILNELCEVGYRIEWRVIRACDLGLPQHRERIFISGELLDEIEGNPIKFATSNELLSLTKNSYHKLMNTKAWLTIEEHGKSFPNWGVAFKGKFIGVNIKEFEEKRELTKFKDILESNVSEKYDFTQNTIERIKNSSKVDKFFNGVQILYNQSGGARMGYTIFGTDGIAPTLTATASRHYERYKINGKYRRLTNVEYARLQGFPDNHCSAVSHYDQYSYIGNAVPPIMAEWAINKLVSTIPQTVHPPRIRQMNLPGVINVN